MLQLYYGKSLFTIAAASLSNRSVSFQWDRRGRWKAAAFPL